MFSNNDELDRPTEWLRRLSEDRALYRRLLSESGTLSRAAYRLARARCRVQPSGVSIPTRAELTVAVREIAAATGTPIPALLSDLVGECEEHGMAVILPLSADAA